ncbi:MACRO domain containing 1 L homeolog isoform X1 [Xenopus laevis]|uniref:MACRO domain containing 1 L homeolog isoform X1 n=1 Tax=Xenopus laevis TaxID=8355 RepID=A0A8J1MUA0_XENLA|nr:MACRO domain containing 1 L homeolog isoform X1 [Xenopus laevis]
MASSGKIDLNSPTITWKEAKSYLKGLNNKQKRDHYSVKDFIKLKQIPVWKDTAKKANIKQPEEGKYAKNKALNEKVSLFRGDITKLEVDAIINTANSSLLGGGGVDGCIHRAAGPLLKLECSSLGGCQTGLAKMTCGYLLPAKYVIHTVGPVVQGDLGSAQEEELRNCYRNSMLTAVEGKLRSVAFPCISTGVFGYPPKAAADMALRTIREFLEENKDKFDRVIICVFLEKDEEIYLQKLPEYFPLDSTYPTCKLQELRWKLFTLKPSFFCSSYLPSLSLVKSILTKNLHSMIILSQRGGRNGTGNTLNISVSAEFKSTH